MKIKAFVFGETRGFGKTSKHYYFKPYQVARQYLVKREVQYVS